MQWLFKNSSKGISHPVFSQKLRRIKNKFMTFNISDSKTVKPFRSQTYDPNVMQRRKCLLLGPSTVLCRIFLHSTEETEFRYSCALIDHQVPYNPMALGIFQIGRLYCLLIQILYTFDTLWINSSSFVLWYFYDISTSDGCWSIDRI